MPGSTAATVYGNQGGGWAPKLEPDRTPIRVDVDAKGGPYNGLSFAMWSYAATPDLPDVVPFAAGRYRLINGVCHQDPDRPKDWATAGHYRWEPA
jgi:hypothetical protein